MGSLSNSQQEVQDEILIVGAGVMGLSAALILKENGYKVKIIARDLPQDVESQDFASPWAGASWDSFASEDDLDAQRREIQTYKKFEELLSVLDEEVLCRAKNVSLITEEEWRDIKENGKWLADSVKDFRLSSEGEEPSFSHETFFLSVPLYTKWMLSQLESTKSISSSSTSKKSSTHPISIERVPSLESLSSALQYSSNSTSLLINATGLGSKNLRETKDEGLSSVRGQTILIKTKEFSKNPTGIAFKGKKKENPQDLIYVIPRAKSGTTILGGTYIENSTDGNVDDKTTERILKKCLEICPGILDDRLKSKGNDDDDDDDDEAWKRIEIERTNVGFRPVRKDGPRIELDNEIKLKKERNGNEGERSIPVIHAYGLGPAGYQTSWGIAGEVLELVKTCIPVPV